MSTFEEVLRQRGGFRTQTATRILPPRQKVSGPRTGGNVGADARAAGDRWYYNAIPLAKYIYTKIEERFAGLPKDAAYEQRKQKLLGEAKSILNEHRNLIFESVLPLFDVTRVGEKDRVYTEADEHAADYFVKNVFYKLAKTLRAWLPEFVHADQLEAAEETLTRLAVTHSELMTDELRNFAFGFRKVVTPK